ncbi:FMN-binding negative transcriptional regulator [Alkalicoccobacillus plakortidis]|uniref:FMN-binding negative transcriptional regulator n=1 Tax=Alkalicoccobacillus plakortidis TaxID=444060 RepID=A0ABT0XN50_9BACI|nr:FMN-binding negative transcriptional regulator [Alkalicoccobacillus plakortidis]MCM2677321.1 FMN-binding negative transcriptional regulator [Alkalicoccobacillus plakortidis]
MYIPKQFQLDDKETIYQIMKENGFATIISDQLKDLSATHLPLMLDDQKNYLYGHFAKANPQWKDLDNQRVLAIFQGPHSYISPSWYETNQAVPTWNYVAVHVYGEIELVGDQELAHSLSELVSKYEKPDSTYQLTDVGAEYIAGLSKGVVGFRIKIESIEANAKLSQNHSNERIKRVIEELEKLQSDNERQIATYMRTYNQIR